MKKRVTEALCSPPVASAVTRMTSGRPLSRGGVRVDLSHPDVPDRVRAAVFWRLYERADIRMIYRYMPSGLDVIDLGASLGVTGSHLLAQDANRRLAAVEANPALIPALSMALADERATILNAAIDYSGKTSVPLQVSASNLRSSIASGRTHGSVSVPTTTLAEVLEATSLKDFGLVADIEGAEEDLILRDEEALSRCRLIVMEMHPTRYRRASTDELTHRLMKLGFEVADRARQTFVYLRRNG